MKITILIIIAFLFFNSFTFASDETNKSDSTGSNEFEYLLYPFVFFSPETNLAFGAGGIAYFKSDENAAAKPSKITFSSFYSINKQYSIDVIPKIYMWKQKIFISMAFNYSKVIDKFYGIGNRTDDNGKEDYELLNLGLTAQINYKVYDNLQYGIIYEILNRKIKDTKENTLLDDKNLRGIDGGLSSGIGISTLWDTRDNIFYPTTGGYYEMKAVFSSTAFGSDYNFNSYELNFRRYQSVAESHVVALQFYMNLVRGFPPFYELAALGGQNIMRGYYEGRYRGQNYFSIQTAYRTKLFWRIGAVAFIGIGDVSNKVSEFSIKYVKASYGFGLRYMMDEAEKLNLRVDVGFGKGTMGVYFSIEEAF
jgi:hypothetical protein